MAGVEVIGAQVVGHFRPALCYVLGVGCWFVGGDGGWASHLARDGFTVALPEHADI